MGDGHLGAVAPAAGGDTGLKVKEAPVVRGNSLDWLWLSGSSGAKKYAKPSSLLDSLLVLLR